MQAVLLVVAAVFLVLAFHPFTTYPLSLALLARVRPRPLALRVTADPASARVALCVCAYNEAGVIRAKAENMLQMRLLVPGLQLHLYLDCPLDGTAAIAGEFADRIDVVAATERHGKTHGMNLLVKRAGTEFVVFSDANVMFEPDAVLRLLAPFADPAVGCVCGQLIYTGADGSATAATGSLYWRLEERIKALESATASIMGADGSIFAIRRALHRPPRPDLIDDMTVSLSILCDGYRIVRAADAVAREGLVSRPGEEFRRKVRIACQAFNVHRALWPRLRRLPPLALYMYLSHKLVRWFAGPLLGVGGLLLLAGLVAAGRPVVAAVLILCSGFGLVAALLRPSSLPGKLLDILFAFVATALGVWRSLRGERFQTWSPPASARDVGLAPGGRP